LLEMRRGRMNYADMQQSATCSKQYQAVFIEQNQHIIALAYQLIDNTHFVVLPIPLLPVNFALSK
jgi:hypothetical protein